MFLAGSAVAEGLSEVSQDQIQPSGVDLTVEAVFEPIERGHIGRSDKHVAERTEVEPVGDEPPVYELSAGAYVVRYGERIGIPDDAVGFVLPRSSLLRNGVTLDTAVWDPGYEGRGEGLLEVHQPIDIDAGARIAQLVLASAGADGTYDGSYQGEHLE